MRHIVRNIILIFILGFIFLTYSCSKEDPIVVDESATYTIKGRITPIKGNSDSVWANVPISTTLFYDSYTLQAKIVHSDTLRTDSNGYFRVDYTIDKPIDEVLLIVISPDLNVPYSYYCGITPNCNIKQTDFYYPGNTTILQGECEE